MIKKDLQKLAIRVEVCFKQFSEGFIKSELMKKNDSLLISSNCSNSLEIFRYFSQYILLINR